MNDYLSSKSSICAYNIAPNATKSVLYRTESQFVDITLPYPNCDSNCVVTEQFACNTKMNAFLCRLQSSLTQTPFIGTFSHIGVGIPNTLLTPKLINQLSAGAHTIQNKVNNNRGNSQIILLSKTVAGLVYQAYCNGDWSTINTSTNLVIDLGYDSLDWLVTNGFEPIYSSLRCFEPGGLNSLTKSIVQTLNISDYSFSPTSQHDIEVFSEKITIDGFDIALPEARNILSSKFIHAIEQIIRSLDNNLTIDRITLSGQGSYLFETILSETMDPYSIHVTNNPAMANTYGLFLATEHIAFNNQHTQKEQA